MARHGIPVRERVCVTCENPSPGPIRNLYYRRRLHGPFFPLLERLKTTENARLFSNGRVPICNSCANYLQRQWNEYERKAISLPIEKRTYRLLSDERWERLNRKSQLDKAASRADDIGPEISSNEENENPQHYQSKLPVPSKSKIPRLARPRRQQVSENDFSEDLDASVEVSERDPLSDRERTTETQMEDKQRRNLLRKLAEIKFQEELDYVEKKVQRTMGMIRFKGSEERIRKIEQELEKKLADDVVKRNEQEREGRDDKRRKMIVPVDNSNEDHVSELKRHIEQEMSMQRREMDQLRENIKSDIARAMDDNYNRNEDLWHFIMERNEIRRSGRSRPYSDGVYLNKQTRSYKKMWEAERMSGGYGEKDIE